MSTLAVALVLMSTLMHASWNLLLKRAGDKLAFTALYLTAATVLYFPLFLYEIAHHRIPPLGWLCIAGTGVVYFGYFIGLALAYHYGDLSLIYPLTRGIGPALTFIGGITLLSETPTPAGACGVAFILCGIVVLHLKAMERWAFMKAGDQRNAVLAALFVGLMYSLYSMIDKVAVGRLEISPPLYIYLTYALSALLVVTWIIRRQGIEPLRVEWKANARACVAVGVLNLFTYLLVLYAMSLPRTPVSYIVPLRTTSVFIGVIFGVKILGEEHLWPKLCGAVLMIGGIVLIAWKG